MTNPAANLNPADNSIPALFEPVHGSAPDIAGQNLADPRATLLSLAMTLEWLAPHHPALGNAAQHLHDTVTADLAKGNDPTLTNGAQATGTRETGQRLYALLAP